MNFLPAPLLGGTEGQTIGIRPEHILLGEDGRVSGKVTHVEKLGGDTNVLVTLSGGSTVTVRLFGQHDVDADTTVGLQFDDAHSFRFDASGARVA